MNMLLSESSIRKIIFKIIAEERGVSVDTLQQSFSSRSTEFKEDDEYASEAGYLTDHQNVSTSGAGVKTDKLKPNTQSFIKRMQEYAKEKELSPIIVTSGFRGPMDQARVMHNNWKKYEKEGEGEGRKYLVGLYYNKRLARRIATAFEKDKGYSGAAEILKVEPISSHGAGKAIDVWSVNLKTAGLIISAIAEEFKEQGIKVKINDETKTKGPHWHLSVSPSPLFKKDAPAAV